MGFLRLGSGSGLLIALAFNIIALSTPCWINVPLGSYGLFEYKPDNGEARKFDNTVTEKVAIAFNIMSDVILLCAAALVLIAERDESKQQFGMIGGATGIIGALFNMIGMASYNGLQKQLVDVSLGTITWGYSLALDWTAFCIAIVSGGIAVAG